MLNRRKFLAAGASVGGGSGPWPASAQPAARIPRVGFITTGGAANNPAHAALTEGLARAGQVAGRTYELEARYSAGENDRLPGLAAELIALPVDMICCVGAVTVHAVRRTSPTIPVLFTIVVDPVLVGLVPNAQRPGGPTSGVTNFDPAQAPAQIRLLKRVMPNLQRLAILGDTGIQGVFQLPGGGSASALVRANMAACEAEGIQPQTHLLRGAAENLDEVFARIREGRAQAVLCVFEPTIFLHARGIVQRATAARLPTMLPADIEAAGAMLTYGSSLLDGVRLMAGQLDRVIKGTPVGELPIGVVTQHRLTVNQRLAREIGVTIPPEILSRANRVVE